MNAKIVEMPEGIRAVANVTGKILFSCCDKTFELELKEGSTAICPLCQVNYQLGLFALKLPKTGMKIPYGNRVRAKKDFKIPYGLREMQVKIGDEYRVGLDRYGILIRKPDEIFIEYLINETVVLLPAHVEFLEDLGSEITAKPVES